jgi:signal peptidase
VAASAATRLRAAVVPSPLAGRTPVLLRRLLAVVQLGVTLTAVWLLLFFAVGPRIFNYRALNVLSGSMTPNYPTGSEVIDTSIPTAELHVGDVLTYHIPVYDHHVESHRVVKIAPAGRGRWLIQTKGDHNNTVDPWVADISSPRVWIARADIPVVGNLLRVTRGHMPLRVFQWIVPLVALGWMLLGIWRDESRNGEPDVPSDAAEISGG